MTAPRITGLVHESVTVREGSNFEEEDVVELRFHWVQDELNNSTNVVVIDRDTAKDLAYLLIDLLLYGKKSA